MDSADADGEDKGEYFGFRKKMLAVASEHDLPETICIMPWIHLNVNPTGSVLQCCVSSMHGEVGDLRKSTLKEIWNNDAMKALRLELLNGGKPASCSKCYEQEENGIPSFRVSAIPYFAKHLGSIRADTNPDGTVDQMQLRYWDFRFSNLCNMKCRTCGHHASSAWYDDMIRIYGPDSVGNDVVIRATDNSIDDIYRILDEQIDNVEEIYFAGGEPLIMDEHYYILEKLIANGRRDVRLRYSTNLMKIRYKKWDNIELWRNFDNVRVYASLDACGARAEYIRHGTAWEVVDDNIRRLVAEPAIEFSVSPTIQVLNLLHIPDLIDYLVSYGVEPGRIRINNVLTIPEHLHINTLGEDYKKIAERLFDAHVSRQNDPVYASDLRSQYDGILSYMDSGRNRTPDQAIEVMRIFKRHITTLDRSRGENMVTTFPELKEHWDLHDNIGDE